jgi:hypothetical protein
MLVWKGIGVALFAEHETLIVPDVFRARKPDPTVVRAEGSCSVAIVPEVIFDASSPVVLAPVTAASANPGSCDCGRCDLSGPE